MTLTGANLDGATVLVDDGLVRPNDASDTSITLTMPAHVAGSVTIRVRTLAGEADVAIDYVGPPSINQIGRVGVLMNGSTSINLAAAISGSYTDIVIVTPPAKGSFIFLRGNFFYNPAPNISGTDSFTFKAVGPGGESPSSQVNILITGTQTIIFSPPSELRLSQNNFEVLAQATSGLPVSVTSTSPSICTTSPASGSNITITLLQTGTCSLVATQPGNDGYPAAQATATIAVLPASLTLSSNAQANGTVGSTFSQMGTVNGGIAPYSFVKLTGSLPPGTTLDPATGIVSGRPMAAGTFAYTIEVADAESHPQLAAATTSAVIAKGSQTVSFTSVGPSDQRVGAAYQVSANATSGLPVTFELDAASQGCSLSGDVVTFRSAGICSINAVQSGDANWLAAPVARRSITIQAASPIISSFTAAPVAYNGGGLPMTTIDVAAHTTNAPTGFVVGSSRTANGGVIQIGPDGLAVYTAPLGFRGNDSFTVVAYNATGSSPPTTVTIPVSNPVLAMYLSNRAATVGVPLSGVMIDTSGGMQPYDCNPTLASGALPLGVHLDPDCTLSGTPKTSGTFSFSVNVTDSSTGTGPFTQTSGMLVLSVVLPAKPIASPTSVNVVYNSPATIDLSGLVTGLHDRLLVVTNPSHGSATVSGDVLVYTPNATYYGADSLLYEAVGPGGTSSAATVTLSVGPPPAPTVQAVAANIDYNSPKAIDLSAAITGVHTQIAVASGPAHGNVSVTGDVATYTPTVGYAGQDSFTFTATGPGGSSSAATITLAIAGPPAPTATASSVHASFQSTKVIDPSGFVTGVFSSVSIATPPAHGTASVSGRLIFYKPAARYAGPDSFTYTATGPGGTSAPAAVTVTVDKGSQTITFNNPGTKNFGTTTALIATASSGLGVTFDSETTDICTVTGANEVNAVKLGTCKIAANQNGDTAYAPAPSVEQIFSIIVAGGPAAIATTTLPNPVRGVFYSQTITATGGSEPYTFTSVGALPGGLTFDNGVISGTPITAGNYPIVVRLTDRAGQRDSRVFSLAVTAPPLNFSPATLPAARVGAAYSSTIVVDGGIAPYTFGISAGALPPGISLSAAGVLSGTPTAAGSFPVTITALDKFFETGEHSYTFIVGEAVPVAVNDNVSTQANNPITVPVVTDDAGVITSIAIGQAPAHGSVTVSGLNTVYTPAHDFYGTDSFTYTATGPGGTSNAATVNVTVVRPAAPVASDVADVAIPYGSSGKAIDVGSAISGGHTGIAIATAPTHGAASIAGDVITYTPTAGYYGPDSFTYTATGLGGTSNAATVSLMVATPAIPVVINKPGVAVPYSSSGTAIDLSSAISGVHNSVAIASGPAHGSVTISGDIATYVPVAGYYGTDSFTFAATGPGGTSTPATVGLTVATPPVPVVSNKSGVAIAYGSSGTAIDLSSAISGVHNSVAVGSPPAHGSVTINGDIATYVPAAGYYGADSFTFTATGPGGTSTPATVGLTVATPPVPVVANKSGVAIAYDSPGTAIDLSGSVSGVYSSIAIGSMPTHGSVTIAGTTATYSPTKGYFGADSFTFTATGPGGTSSAATVSVAVATPPAPVVKSGSATVASSTQTQKSVDINLSALVSGEYTSVELVSSPAHGTATIHGAMGALSASAIGSPTVIATYTPASGFAGTDTFSFVAVGPGGRSAPAAITVTVTGTVPTAAAKTAKAIDNQTVSIELTDGATEGPFTGAAVVSVSPADKATTKIVEGGGATARTYRLDVTPAPHFGGTIVVTYTLSNQFGTSAPATVTIAVTARPDPSLDPNVRALSDAQAESTRRFAQAQSRNFLQRAEQLHHGGGSGKARMGISLGLTDMTRAGSPGYQMGQREEQDIADRSRNGSIGADDQTEAAGKSSFSGGHSRGDGERRTGSVAIWSGGQIEIGTRDQTTDRDKISMTSGGLSAGADLKLSDAATVGIGGGVGFDSSKIGGQAASLSGDSTVVAAYGSVAPAKDIFVDLVIGYGDLSFRSRRAVNGATASGSRDGSMWFGAASAGIDRIDGDLRWSLYGRGEWLDGKLGAYSETGADIMDLRFDERDVSSLTGVLGGRIELNEKLTIGSFRPRVRVEWSHEFQDSSVQMLDYADIPGNALYGIRTEGWNRNQYEVAFGGGLTTLSRWVVDIEMGLRGASGERDGRLTVKLSKEF